jgi:hypothetical protein
LPFFYFFFFFFFAAATALAFAGSSHWRTIVSNVDAHSSGPRSGSTIALVRMVCGGGGKKSEDQSALKNKAHSYCAYGHGYK